MIIAGMRSFRSRLTQSVVLTLMYIAQSAEGFVSPHCVHGSAALRILTVREVLVRRPTMQLDGAKSGLDPRMTKRTFLFAALASSVNLKGKPVIADEGASASATDDQQIVDVDQINGKKFAVLGGALFVADLISGALTGRSVLRIVGNDKAGVPQWQQEMLDKLVEKEKKEAAERMGVSVTTSSKPRGPSASGDYAANDPFEIAKQRYKKKESVEDLQRNLRDKLDGKPTLGFDKQEEDE